MSSNSKASRLAKWLIQENENLSYRAIAKIYFPPIVKPGTLNRIAKTGGDWMPKKEAILIALRIKQPPKIKTPLPVLELQIKKNIRKMAKETRHPETYQQTKRLATQRKERTP
jgi:hypothetical protein